MSGIYKGYDVRGIYGEELTEEIAYSIGRAFVAFLDVDEVVIGMDMRDSSKKLFESLAKGITDQGANVINIGLASTPMFYFAACQSKSGIMITASHNPAEYNGFKFVRENGIPLSFETGIKEIKELVEANKFEDSDIRGKIIEKDVMQEYIDFVLSFKREIGNYKIVVDAGNGMEGYIFPKIFDQIGINYVKMYFDLDGNFPNHEANPIKEENLKDLREKVVEEKADLGIAFDGDGDRVVFIDELGNSISSDKITALVGIEVLEEHPGSLIMYDLRSSKSVKEAIEEARGKAKMCRVGHSFIKAQMREENAVFAGELSGHFYIKENHYCENSEIVVLKLLNNMAEKKMKISDLIKPLNKYFASGEINFKVDDKEGMMRKLEQKYSEGQISHLDGVLVSFDDWWFNVRASNTEPLLRLNVEADSKELLNQKKEELIGIIKA